MSKIRVDPMILVVRCYKEDIDSTLPLKEEHSRYDKIFNILLQDNGYARLTGAIVAPSYSELSEVFDYLRELGYTKVGWRHKDKEEEFKI